MDQARGPLHEPLPILFGLCSLEILLFNVTHDFGIDGLSNLPIVDPLRLKSSGKCHN